MSRFHQLKRQIEFYAPGSMRNIFGGINTMNDKIDLKKIFLL